MEGQDSPSLTPIEMENSISNSLKAFRANYELLLKEVLEEGSEEEEDRLDQIEIDVNAATAELSEELRAALEDRALADKYLANLRTFMSHRRSQSMSSIVSGKGDYSIPNTPLQTSFAQPLTPKPLERAQPDPLSRLLDAVPYQTRLVNGVPSLTTLEQSFQALRIPELELPVISESTIQTTLDTLYKIRDDLYIHLNGGPLVKNINQNNIGEKKKEKVLDLLDDITNEIGFYEEFIKKANYLSLENILNEPDHWETDDALESDTMESESSLMHFDSSSDLSRHSYKPSSFLSSPQRMPSQLSISSTPSSSSMQRLDSSAGESSSSISHLDSMDHSDSMMISSDGTLRNIDRDNIEPWEAFRWTPLKKISDQLYSDAIKQESGLISVMAVSGLIALGTTRSLVFVYDFSQNLKCILGSTNRAIELGSVTSLAISADHTTIACGHSQGYIVVWDIRKPSHPIRTINPISPSQVAGVISSPQQQVLRKEGHVKGTSILHVGFVGVKKSVIVSGDDQGMAFYHVLYKMILVNGVDTIRILGRYQNLSITPEIQRAQNVAANARMRLQSPAVITKPRRPSTVFAMQPLPLGQIPHPAENFGLVALLTPYKMIIVGLKPTTQTQYKFLKPKTSHVTPVNRIDGKDCTKANVENLSGCLAWLPVLKSRPTMSKESSKDTMPASDPMLAFSWGNHLFIIHVSAEKTGENSSQTTNKFSRPTRPPLTKSTKRSLSLEFVRMGEWKCREAIVGIQWINKQILILFTANEEMILFDPKNMQETQHTSLRNKQLVYHDWFNAPLKDLVMDAANNMTVSHPGYSASESSLKTVEMAYFGSIKGYKGKLFLLGLNQIYYGTLLSWADRILALVQAGDFLESIELATSFYNGIGIQTVIGLPDDDEARKAMVGEKLMDLLLASLNYTFSSNRSYEGMTNEVAGGELIVYQTLARGCIQACLSMNNTDVLFDTVYERFADNDVKGVFLEELEPCIVKDRVPDVPPAIMKALVDHYSKKRLLDQLEQVIWHVNPRCLDIDQIVSMCHREGMYEAMMYVWNKSMFDYVSPVVEMLKVIRSVLREENNETKRHNAEKLFDYLKLILTGRSFPDGATCAATDEASEARSAVYSFVFSGRCVIWPPVGGKLVLTADDDEAVSEPTYPYLRLLLRFNTKKLLEALEVAFEDPWLNGGEDILSSKFEEEVPGKVISRQIIVNTLLDVMGGGLTGSGLPPPPPRPKQSFSASTVHSFGGNRPSPNLHISVPVNDHHISGSTYDYISNENIILLYTFIASNFHKYTTFILLPPKTLNKILVRLAEDHDPETRQARQKAVENLLTVYTPTNEEYVISLYEEAGFWKVLEEVYRRDKKYGKLVEAYLKDEEQRDQVFRCVQTLLSSKNLNERQIEDVKRVFMIRISQFVEIDGQKAAQIVEYFMGGDHKDAIHRLEEDQEFDDDEHHSTVDKRLFSYLRGLLEPYLIEQENDDHNDLLMDPQFPHIDAEIQERYIELMCRFDPSGVFNYFNTKLDDGVPLDKIQGICEKHGVMDAVVWIMEKCGDTQGALEKMLEVAKDKNVGILTILKKFKATHAPLSIEELSIINSCIIGLKGVLRVSTRLCESSSRKSNTTYITDLEIHQEELHPSVPELSIEEEDSSMGEDSIGNEEEYSENDEVETLWFRLLDAYVEASIEIHNALGNEQETKLSKDIYERIVSSYKSYVQSILTSLLLSTSPQISLPRLLLRLIHSQARGETTFADFRDIFLSMLDTYKYEGKLIELTNRLFDRDLFGSLQEMMNKRSKGWRPQRAICEICNANILDLALLQPSFAWGLDDEDCKPPVQKRYIVFNCGHGFHVDCLNLQSGSNQECAVCQHGHSVVQKSKPLSKKAKGKEKAT
ncbi:Golgi CORVET complex core vacuolar protein 8-domain-containing protein [Pilobolus umbonatus]|nr:Golgi CORVET complex core vacuolar protein 8-domain-containing protein [Pilobolus umbonatus]